MSNSGSQPREQSSGFCPHCQKRQRLLRDRVEFSPLDIIFGLLTVAIWILIAHYLADPPYRCQSCGTVVEPGAEAGDRADGDW